MKEHMCTYLILFQNHASPVWGSLFLVLWSNYVHWWSMLNIAVAWHCFRFNPDKRLTWSIWYMTYILLLCKANELPQSALQFAYTAVSHSALIFDFRIPALSGKPFLIPDLPRLPIHKYFDYNLVFKKNACFVYVFSVIIIYSPWRSGKKKF